MILKELNETKFEDGDLMLYDITNEQTYILNRTSTIVYKSLKHASVNNVEEAYNLIKIEYEDFPLEFFNEVIKKLKEFGIIK